MPAPGVEDLDRGTVVDGLVEEAHNLVFAARDVLAHEVSADGKLPVAAVDEDRELDAVGASEVAQRVHGRADSATGVEHVVDEDDGFALECELDVGHVDLRGKILLDIVAVERDVQAPDGDLEPLDLFDAAGELGREHVSPGNDPHQRNRRGAVVRFENLMSDTRERTLDGA